MREIIGCLFVTYLLGLCLLVQGGVSKTELEIKSMKVKNFSHNDVMGPAYDLCQIEAVVDVPASPPYPDAQLCLLAKFDDGPTWKLQDIHNLSSGEDQKVTIGWASDWVPPEHGGTPVGHNHGYDFRLVLSNGTSQGDTETIEDYGHPK